MDEFNRGIDQAQKKFKDFSSNIKGISDGINKTYDGLKDVLSPAVDGFKAVEGVGKKAGSAVVKGLQGFAAAATAVGGFGTAAVKSGMQFDATMSEVSAISGATGQEFDALREKALEMGAKTKFSASEAASAMTYMGMAGWKAGDMISGIEGIMNLAAASGEDLATTSDIVTDALTAFGLSAGDSGHFANVMAVAASNANTNVGMMGETFKYVAPVAGALGYSVDDTALAIGLMANSGIKATQAGTALRSIFTRLSTDAGASSKNLGALGVLTEQLGVQFYNTDGSARELNDVLTDSRAVWAGLSEEQQITYAKTIAGQEAMSGWLALMNAAPADVEKLTAALENCNGAAEQMAATMVDNLQGDLTLLGSAFESLQIAISDSLTPTLREFAQFGQKAMAGLLEGFQGGGVSGVMSALSGIVTDGVKMLAEKAPEFASVSLQFIEALASGILNNRLLLLQTAYQIIDDTIAGIDSWLSTNSAELVKAGFNIVDTIFHGFSEAGELISKYIGDFVPVIADAFLSYHDSLFTVGLDILGAIGTGIVENKEKIQEMASETIQHVVESLRDNAPAIIEGGIALLEALAGAIVENLPLILETGAAIIGELVAGISTASPAVMAIIGTAVLPHITKIIDVVGGIGQAVGGVVKLVSGGISTILGIGKTLMGGIQSLFSLIMAHPVVAVVTAIIAAVVLLWNNCEEFRNAVGAIWDAIVGFFQAAAEGIRTAFDGVVAFFQGVWNGIQSIFQGVAEFFGGLFQAAADLVQAAWNAVVDFFRGVWQGIQSVFSTVAEVLGGFFRSAVEAVQSAWGVIVEFFSGVWQGIQGVFSAVAEVLGGFFSAAAEAVQSAWEAVTEFFSGVWEGIQGVFSATAEVLGGFFRAAWEAVQTAWNAAAEFFGGIADGIHAAFEAVTQFLGDAFSAAWEVIDGIWGAAVEFFSGIWDGITGIFGTVAEWFGGLFTDAWNAVTSAWDGVTEFFTGIWEDITGVFSDVWEKFKEIGGNIVQGIWDGVSGAWDRFWTWLSGKVSGIIDGVKNLLGIHSPSTVFAGIGENMALGLSEGWDDQYSSIKRKIESGMDFGTASIGLTANGSPYAASAYGQNEQQPVPGTGNMTVNIYSPKEVDPLTASRLLKKEMQKMTTRYV